MLLFAVAGLLASPAAASDATIKRGLLQGVAHIRGSHSPKKLDRQLARTIVRLRRDHSSTAAGRRGRELAIRGFAWTRKGLAAEIAFDENDSGNIEAAVRDALRADRCLNKGADLLRAAGRSLGLRIGRLRGR